MSPTSLVFGSHRFENPTFPVLQQTPPQIDCYDGSSVMAPGGCTQLHFGLEGIIKSFNFEGVQYLNNQNYHSCIRSAAFFFIKKKSLQQVRAGIVLC